MVHRGGGVTREASERLPMCWGEHTRLPGAGGKSERVRAPFVQATMRVQRYPGRGLAVFREPQYRQVDQPGDKPGSRPQPG